MHDTVAQIKSSFGKLIQLVKASKRNTAIAAVVAIALLFTLVNAWAPGLFWHLDLDASVEACGLEVSYPSEWSRSSASEDRASESPTSVIFESENGAHGIVDKSFIYDDDFDAKDSSDCKEEFKKLRNSLGSKGFTLGQNGEMQVGERDGYTCVSQAVAFKNSDGNPCSGILTAVYVGNNEAYVFVGAEDGYKPDADMVERVAASAKVVKADPVTVTFESDGEIIQTIDTYDMGGGASVKAPISPKKDGYLFDGWTDKDTSEAVECAQGAGYEIVSNIEANSTLVPNWAKALSVTFSDGAGKTLSKQEVKSGGSVDLPDDPERKGYKFDSWKIKNGKATLSAGDDGDSGLTNITTDVVVEAIWKREWTVTYTDGCGTTLDTQKVLDGGSAVAPSDPDRAGYIFVGWDGKQSNIKGNVTIKAKWRKEPTLSQQNALDTAASYLNYSAFSHDGLVKQLEYEKYSHEDAVYAADYCGADWKEQAAKSAKQYLDYSSFSRDGLIDQLLYEGFTRDQAVYGVNQAGL